MKKIFLFLLLIGLRNLTAKEPEIKKICSIFSECVAKGEKTDIHRKKMTFFEEALNLYKVSDGEKVKWKVLLKRANSIILEAGGDTGYKGEIPLKVSHKPEYKKSQNEKAKVDLMLLEENRELLSPEDQKLLDELKTILNSDH